MKQKICRQCWVLIVCEWIIYKYHLIYKKYINHWLKTTENSKSVWMQCGADSILPGAQEATPFTPLNQFSLLAKICFCKDLRLSRWVPQGDAVSRLCYAIWNSGKFPKDIWAHPGLDSKQDPNICVCVSASSWAEVLTSVRATTGVHRVRSSYSQT